MAFICGYIITFNTNIGIANKKRFVRVCMCEKHFSDTSDRNVYMILWEWKTVLAHNTVKNNLVTKKVKKHTPTNAL